ncbi:sensor histidine kinase [Spirosoma sp.]|uniref:sensor histidine kinase n=1 Tax=Spirosoma sp. TaxID=1899569 RepID=UPI003B3B5E6E
MTIRNRLTIRFTALVSSILLLAFVSIYAFCWYFTSSDFYRRLERKANTAGNMLIRYRLDAQLIRQLGQLRKDQLPNQKITIFDGRDSVIFVSQEDIPITAPKSVLAKIRQNNRKDFQLDGYSFSGIRFTTTSGQYVVMASAINTYGNQFLRSLLWSLIGLYCLIASITAFSGWLFAGDALRPMQQIDQTVSRIFPHNQAERLPIDRDDDEIRRLSVTINRLLDRITESFQLQRMFVANVSHELKNPLTQISSQLEVSLLKQRDPETYKQTIHSVLEDIRDLSSLTHELLQLSQLNQDNAEELLTQVVRMDELVWDIQDEVNALSPRYKVTIKFGPLPDDPDQASIRGNKALLKTALKNLTENACKFSNDGRALIQVYFEQHTLKISVQNQGQPIQADELPYIFEPFYRSRQTADVRGYGIGLSLVERIVRLHKGRISVSSEQGQSTLFSIELPH